MNKKEQREQELLAIKNAYIRAFAEVHGQECADKSEVWYEQGWFHLRMVRRDGIGFIHDERPSVVRSFQLSEMASRLQQHASMKKQLENKDG